MYHSLKAKKNVKMMQETAISKPCLLAVETIRLEYGWMLDQDLSLVLTVNRGYE